MAYNSNIEWTHHTANLWWGCTEVHQGCDNCYARVWANRYGVKWGNDANRKAIKGTWGNLLGMQAKAAAKNEIHRVFVGSMMDIFENDKKAVDGDGVFVAYTSELRRKFFEQVIPACPNLLFLLLTKRPSNINKYIPDWWEKEQPYNVMYGASVVDEKSALDVKRHLDKVEGRKFLSIEPQLEFIDFSINGLLDGIDWLIQGGESGAGKRPFDLEWARHAKRVCIRSGVPYFFKQIDKVQSIPEDLQWRDFPRQL
jgi:protein gp37